MQLGDQDWASGPSGDTDVIGRAFFEKLATAKGLNVSLMGAPVGLTPDFAKLGGPAFDASAVHPAVRRFYERTSEYSVDAWGEWCGAFRPFGWLLRRIFSRRLQQLNVPLSALETSRGMTSRVMQLSDPTTGAVRYTAWVRELAGTGDVIYAGSYSTCSPPGFEGPCIKVAFPLPNGYALARIRRQTIRRSGLLLCRARGGRPQFGEVHPYDAGEHSRLRRGRQHGAGRPPPQNLGPNVLAFALSPATSLDRADVAMNRIQSQFQTIADA